MRTVFIGSIEFSWQCLEEILKKNLTEIVGVFNLEPKNSNSISDYKNLKDLAKKYNISHFYFKNINDKNTVKKIRSLKPELILVFGLSQIIKSEILSIAKRGILGTHPTLLPKNRGRAPIPWSIIKGLKKSGLTFFYLREGADTGDIVSQSGWIISDKDDASTLYKKMTKAAKKMLNSTLPKIARGVEKRIKQPTLSNYWPARKPEDGKISWNSSYKAIDKLIRATTRPYPGAFCYIQGQKVIIWKSQKVTTKEKVAMGIIIRSDRRGLLIKAKGGAILAKDWEPRIFFKTGALLS